MLQNGEIAFPSGGPHEFTTRDNEGGSYSVAVDEFLASALGFLKSNEHTSNGNAIWIPTVGRGETLDSKYRAAQVVDRRFKAW